MPIPKLKTLTPEEFLAFDSTAEVRHEYVRGELFALSGTTLTHNELVFRITAALRSTFLPRGCRVLFEAVKLHVESANCYFYPDVFVTCDARDRTDPLIQRHANLVVEVLSESTEVFDRSEKLSSYPQLDTLQAYVLVNTALRRGEVYERQDGPFWRYSALGPGETLRVEKLDLSLDVSALYADTDVPDVGLPLRSDGEA